MFINSRAGQNSLAGNTDSRAARALPRRRRLGERATRSATSSPAQRRRRSRWSWATSPAARRRRGKPCSALAVELPGTTGILIAPGDAIIPIDADGGSSSPGNEAAPNAIDGTLAKYLNFGEVNSGFIVTPSHGRRRRQEFSDHDGQRRAGARPQRLAALRHERARSPASPHSTGTAESWTLIGSGALALPAARDTLGPVVNVTNNTAYTSYKMLFTGVKNAAAANSMQIAEVQFFGDRPPARRPRCDWRPATPRRLAAVTDRDGRGGQRRHQSAKCSARHVDVRLVLQRRHEGRQLGAKQSHVSKTPTAPRTRSYLPIISLAPNQRLDLWVSEDGSTYYGTPLQTEPDFSLLARPSESSAHESLRPDAAGLRRRRGGQRLSAAGEHRVRAQSGPDPDDPLYYVTELVRLDPGRPPRRHEADVRHGAARLQSARARFPAPASRGSPASPSSAMPSIPRSTTCTSACCGTTARLPGGPDHYPKVERITSAAGGLTMASRTVLLNMQPETQGQSHQISNITIGPDGKLYVHNGDGFNAATAQNLDSVPRQDAADESRRHGAGGQSVLQRRQRHHRPRLRLRLRPPQSVRRRLAAVRRQALRGRERPQRRPHRPGQRRRQLRLRTARTRRC